MKYLSILLGLAYIYIQVTEFVGGITADTMFPSFMYQTLSYHSFEIER